MVAVRNCYVALSLYLPFTLLHLVSPITMASGINEGDDRLVFESSEAITIVPTFDELGLKEDLLRGIYAYSQLSFYI
jgi:hypothetical protein